MATPTNAVPVPSPAPGSHNVNRPAGLLLRSQCLHMREALVKHLEEIAAVIAIDPKALRTEGEVSAYIHRATSILHTRAARPRNK